MSESNLSADFIPYMPPANAAVEVHNVAAITDKALWSGHVFFAALVIVGFVLIFAARGPRRRDAQVALESVGESRKISGSAEETK